MVSSQCYSFSQFYYQLCEADQTVSSIRLQVLNFTFVLGTKCVKKSASWTNDDANRTYIRRFSYALCPGGFDFHGYVGVNVMRFAIWYHLYNFKKVKNTHGGVTLKVTFFHGCFSGFLNCTNGTKSRKTSHILTRFYDQRLLFYGQCFFRCNSLQGWKHFFAISPDATNLLRLTIMTEFPWYQTNCERCLFRLSLNA